MGASKMVQGLKAFAAKPDVRWGRGKDTYMVGENHLLQAVL